MDELGFIDISSLPICIIEDEDIPQFTGKLTRQHERCVCGKIASYGPVYKNKRIFCSKCKPPHYVIKGKPKCECGKIATFGPPDTRKRLSCSGCKLPGYIDLVTKKCPCGKVPSFGCPIDRKKISCSRCKLPHHVSLAVRSKGANC